MEFRAPDEDRQADLSDASGVSGAEESEDSGSSGTTAYTGEGPQVVEAPEPVLEPLPDDVPAESAEPTGRRYPSTIGGAFYLLVLAVSAVGLVIVANGNWRLGVKWIASSLVFAALVRLVLPASEAGMLAVRRRWVDVLLLVVVGVALFFLSTSIPNQPPL